MSDEEDAAYAQGVENGEARALKRIRALEADAVRLNYIDSSDADVLHTPGGGIMILRGDPMGSAPHPRGATVREAIDKAMAEEKKS